MTNKLNAWNLQLNEAAKECQALTMQILLGLSEELTSRRPFVCMLLDAVSLLDFLSGYVAYMTARKDQTSYCQPMLSEHASALPAVRAQLHAKVPASACMLACYSALPTPCRHAHFSLRLLVRCALPHVIVVLSAGVLDVEAGLHPVHGCLDPLTREVVVMKPNSVSMSTFCSFVTLFGANSSGKSTLMKQTGLLCVLAQAGLWVPARSMIIHPFDHICTRMSVQNCTRANTSTLMIEAQVCF